MKFLHRRDLYGWSVFNKERELDFHSVLWDRGGDNVLVDPLPLTDHDYVHANSHGKIATIVVTNSDHVRDTERLRKRFGAQVAGPAGERDSFPIECDRWIEDGDEIAPGMIAYTMNGSKTAGELALLLDGDTLITGDLIRSHEGGKLCTLPPMKLVDSHQAHASIERLAAIDTIEAVLVGDGWPIFRCGGQALLELAQSLRS